MSSSTKRASDGGRGSAAGAPPRLDDQLTVATFLTPWGEGRLALIGDLPFEMELPDGAAGRITGEPAGRGGAGETRPARGAKPAAVVESAAEWTARLERYFRAEPVGFPLDVDRFCAAHGFTAFETSVYRALAAVPYGEIASYRDLAVAAGRPRAWRAVGGAMALNPLPVILPCHRVVRSNGTLGHYGADPTWKERLLRHEGVDVVHGPDGAPRADAKLFPAGHAGPHEVGVVRQERGAL